jgi:4a-hydroxytetrahydrobiopterin dehydratase
MAVLDEAEVRERISQMSGWEIEDGALVKEYKRADFADSMRFVNRIAEAAEAANHHPDILVSWDRVKLTWVNHAEGGITARDLDMARRSDELAKSP